MDSGDTVATEMQGIDAAEEPKAGAFRDLTGRCGFSGMARAFHVFADPCGFFSDDGIDLAAGQALRGAYFQPAVGGDQQGNRFTPGADNTVDDQSVTHGRRPDSGVGALDLDGVKVAGDHRILEHRLGLSLDVFFTVAARNVRQNQLTNPGIPR